MLADRLRDRHEDHAGLLQLLLERRRNGDRIRTPHRPRPAATLWRFIAVQRAAIRPHDARQHLLLAQRNAELLVGLEDFRIDLVERLRRRVLLGRRVVVDVLVVDRRIVDPRPCGLAHGEPVPVGEQAPFQHPVRLLLLGRDEADGIFGKALRRLFGLDLRLKPVLVLVDVDQAHLLDGLLYGRHLVPSAAVSRTAGWIWWLIRLRRSTFVEPGD